MFELGFQEMVLIMIIALIVVGPERLPGLARKAGMWVGKMRRFVSSVKEDIDKEIAAEDLKKILKEQADASGIHEIIEETRDTIEKAEQQYVLSAMPDENDSDLEKPEEDKNKPGGSDPEALAKLKSTSVGAETAEKTPGESGTKGADETATSDTKQTS